ncbi:N-acyl amino acid synthase FeeM domain-containing protein [Vibrio salinus]|uniref:N-acyl amino acid synthase FeeM domain-containing protein n=1 Tax=Vibrio salinus TaxID=2899784 RepID=UPI001E2917CE|nr:hypothetical protein [Vibrio salinus]MCE0493282.1 hypothetical protein [Vibrio salinus]
MNKEKVIKPELNGKTVPFERRNEVRISKGDEGRQESQAVTYKIAVGKQEIEDAFRLVWNNYVEAGLQENNHEGIRFTKYHLLPNTKVFIANYHEELAAGKPEEFKKGNGKIVGTVSLVLDSPMGLPMEEFCGEEIAKMRSQGKRLAEVVAFALNPEYSKYKVFLHMFKLMFQYAAMKNVTDLCCSVTQRHIRFYRKVCLFEPIGDLVPYSAAYKLKVQGHRLNIEEANKKAELFYAGKEFDADLHRFFFTESYNRSKGEGKPLSEDLLTYFISEKTHFVDTLEDKDLSCLRAQYQEIGVRFPF